MYMYVCVCVCKSILQHIDNPINHDNLQNHKTCVVLRDRLAYKPSTRCVNNSIPKRTRTSRGKIKQRTQPT